MSTDFDNLRKNMFKATNDELYVLEGDKWVAGQCSGENMYPIGIVPAIKMLDEASIFFRCVGNTKLEQIVFVGKRNDINKTYFIGAQKKNE